MLIGQIEYEILEAKIWHFWQERYLQPELPLEGSAEWSSWSKYQAVYLYETVGNAEGRNAVLSAYDD